MKPPEDPTEKPPPRERMQVVLVGHVDHGKSTLLGRLYADTGSLPEGHLEKVRQICARLGKPFEYAFLFDAFLEEQEQGITIDTARTFFGSAGREYLMLDAPGHKEFLKNMISGASRAEAAVLIVDSAEGVQEQTRRHGYMLSLLGIRQLVVVVNKMDLVGYDRRAFAGIESDCRAFLAELDLQPLHFIPASAREGDNVARPSDRMPWYPGPTLLESLGSFAKLPARSDLPLRFPVQDVYKFDGRRIIAGRVEAGELKVGDTLLFSPSRKSAQVKRIEAFNAGVLPLSVPAGRCTGFTLGEQIFVERGEIASLEQSPPEVCSRFRANVFWMGKKALEMGRSYRLRLTTVEAEVRLEEVAAIIDASTLERVEHRDRLWRNDVALVLLRSEKPIPLDRYRDIDATGRFVIIDGFDIAGGGAVLEPLREKGGEGVAEEARQHGLQWLPGEVLPEERVRRNGHRPGIVILSWGPGGGKLELARLLERRLFDAGRQVSFLDGGSPQQRAASGSGEGCGRRMLRHFREVAPTLLGNGQIVITTGATVPPEEHKAIRALVHPDPVVAVFLSSPGSTPPEGADLVLDGAEELEQAVGKVLEKMEQAGVLCHDAPCPGRS